MAIFARLNLLYDSEVAYATIILYTKLQGQLYLHRYGAGG
jgi:hypothetical protein